MPSDLEAALRSSRNLHNPALAPLVKSFIDALKSTTMYSELVSELHKIGFEIKDITFEKFSISAKGIVPVPDVHINCKKRA